MTTKSAQYLIRFDDLCPTMATEPFERYLSIIASHRVRPILAVIPDNQDPAFMLQDANPSFWTRMRALESAGATIALQGYRHQCANRGQSILGLSKDTEFAGVEERLQREWIRSGLNILRGYGLCPRLFVAPRHGFDRTTLRVLAREGLGFLSDGFARRPFTRGEVVWIPQQLETPERQETGLWTIRIHANTASPSLEENLRNFMRDTASQFTTFDRVLIDYDPAKLGWTERVSERMIKRRIRSLPNSGRGIIAA
jgi:predicted deacetylase